jgi:hypothetical protein
MKHFKARIEPPKGQSQLYALEVWLEAVNIVQAAMLLVKLIEPIGLDGDHVTKLIELDG